MKHYTTPEQTAKLIELGFEKPKFEVEMQMCNVKGQPLRVATIVGDYSIGELIEMLPSKIDGRNLVFERYVELDQWLVCYEVCLGVYSMSAELCDALYNTIVKLKENGVI